MPNVTTRQIIVKHHNAYLPYFVFIFLFYTEMCYIITVYVKMRFRNI